MKNGRNKNAGFSLIELMVVVLIVLVIAAIAIPNFVTVVADTRLRSGMSALSGLIQRERAIAIKNNGNYSVHFTTLSYGPVAYVEDASLAAGLVASEPQVELGAPVTKMTTLTGSNAPTSPLDNTILGFTPQTGDVSFNPRGLPCTWNTGAGACTNAGAVGFVYYFTDTRPLGENGWAAVTVSPGGRVKVWTWNGTAWN